MGPTGLNYNTKMNLEDEISDDEIDDNWEFLKCDNLKCYEFGKQPLCYFDIYFNCYLYEPKGI